MHASSVRCSGSFPVVSSLSADEVRSRLAEIRVERSRLDAEEALLVARLNELSVERSSCVVPEFEMTRYAGLRSREASRVVQRSAMLDVLPEFGSALASGSIVAGHVDVLADSLKKVSDTDREAVLGQADVLLRSARRLTVDQFAKHLRSEVSRLSADKGLSVFERQRRATFLKFWNDPDGMVHLRGAFDPERGSVLLSRLEQRVEAMFHSGDVAVPVEVGPGVEPRSLALSWLLPRLRGMAGGRDALASRQHGAGVDIEHRTRLGAPRNCLESRHPPTG